MLIRIAHIWLLLILCMNTGRAQTLENASCHTVRLGELSRDDVIASNVFAQNLLTLLGYKTEIVERETEKSILDALSKGQADVFFGLYLPISQETIRPHSHKGDVLTIAKNFTGRRIGLMINPAGQDTIMDVSELATRFIDSDPNIYVPKVNSSWIEHVLTVIDKNTYNAGEFHVRAVKNANLARTFQHRVRHPIITFFLLSEPFSIPESHRYINELVLLTDYEGVFGKVNGENDRYTLTRAHYQRDCPNLNALFTHLTFDLRKIEMAFASRDELNVLIKSHIDTHFQDLVPLLKKVKAVSGQDALEYLVEQKASLH